MRELGINNIFELFSFLPSKYIDLKKPISITDAQNNQYSLFEGSVDTVSSVCIRGKKGFSILFKDILSVKNIYFKVQFYNQPYLKDVFIIGQSYRIFGKPTISRGSLVIVNPIYEKADNIKRLSGIFSVYPLKGIIGQNTFKNIVNEALNSAILASRSYKGEIAAVNDDLLKAFYSAHNPVNIVEGLDAIEKLATIDTAIIYQLYKITGNTAANYRKVLYNIQNNIILSYKNLLPYELTESQNDAISDIFNELTSQKNISRIINGDVGSGKTAVAFFALFAAFSAKKQAVMMAPTEILAAQHFQKFVNIFKAIGINSALLTSSLSFAEKKKLVADISDGKINVVFGTQALISKSVKYKSLALAVIDEQHKFGVSERAELENKGAVDVLSLTATPIPRSLALTFYDDIAISYIKKREDAQTCIRTEIIQDEAVASVLTKIIDNAVNGSEQSFIVCPSITDSEGYEIYSIEKFQKDYIKFLNKTEYAILHGKMSSEEKRVVMSEFASGKIKILLSTTVVEVGIDTKAKNIMIMNADRFGLATLHQLRGRVGRDGLSANCFLHSGSASEKAANRLEALIENTDGQALAEIDFDTRGAGEILGQRQSGLSKTPIFGLKLTSYVLKNAKTYAENKLCSFSGDTLLSIVRCPKSRVELYFDKVRDLTLNS